MPATNGRIVLIRWIRSPHTTTSAAINPLTSEKITSVQVAWTFTAKPTVNSTIPKTLTNSEYGGGDAAMSSSLRPRTVRSAAGLTASTITVCRLLKRSSRPIAWSAPIVSVRV